MTEVAKYVPDTLDRAIIGHLRSDGRAALATVATALGVTRGTVQNRIARLLATGTVLGFTVRMREDYDAGTIRAIMLIEVRGKSTTQVIRKLRGLPDIHALHTTNGAWDLIAELRADDLVAFDRLLREVRMIDGIENSETSILLSSV